MGGFEAEWLAARRPYDVAALDRPAIAAIREWGSTFRVQAGNSALVVVDLGSGTGTAIRRATTWLAPRSMVAYAVDTDPSLLASAAEGASDLDREGVLVPPIQITGNLLLPLDGAGGPPDGSVDLVLGHALADLLPLDRLAVRVAALLRPGGLAHLALTYDGLTAFEPTSDAALDATIQSAFHRHMNRGAAADPTYGGSTAGRRLPAALVAAGLEIVREAPANWHVRADDGLGGRVVLDRLIRFVVESVREIGGVPERDLATWEQTRRRALEDGALVARVVHRDVLARKPLPSALLQDC